jgi:hypothetical protein
MADSDTMNIDCLDEKHSSKIFSFLEVDGTHTVLIHLKNIFNDDEVATLVEHLSAFDIEDWESGTFYGKVIQRLQRWYHENDINFGDGYWHNTFPRWNSYNYEEWLTEFQSDVEKRIVEFFEENDLVKKYGIEMPSFNSLLLNYYQSFKNKIGMHKDNIKIFGDNPTIVSVSFGASRYFDMEKVLCDPKNPKSTKKNKKKPFKMRFKLDNGDVVIMAGASQRFWSHGLPRMDVNNIEHSKCQGEFNRKCQKRWNMTFRKHIAHDEH